ncbi:MAG: hypothetical protein ACOX6G_08250 [Christensenellales bacterium]|jgi:exopolyphosphatase/guanosine-5'-triphosphate,3'-diphosphate pyrophosphatase
MNDSHVAALPAVIVVGSNSTRLLYYLPDGQKIRNRLETRLMQAFDGGSLTQAGIQKAADDVHALSLCAKEAGFLDIRVFATSAARDADNKNELLKAIFQKTRLNTIIWSGEEEADYSFLGAVSDASHMKGPVGVIDIGGGSSEVVVVGTKEGLRQSMSLQLGAGRLLETNPINRVEDIALAMRQADRITHDIEPVAATSWTLIGGTGTALACAYLSIPFDAGLPQGGAVVPLAAAEELLYKMADMPLMERKNIVGVPPTRIDILPTGLIILLSLARRLSISSLMVSENTNADGYLFTLQG